MISARFARAIRSKGLATRDYVGTGRYTEICHDVVMKFHDIIKKAARRNNEISQHHNEIRRRRNEISGRHNEITVSMMKSARRRENFQYVVRYRQALDPIRNKMLVVY